MSTRHFRAFGAWLAAFLAILWSGCDSGSRPAIHIAAVGPMTGSTAARGKDLQQAAQLAATEATSTGGLNGRPIQSTSTTIKTNPIAHMN
jgi:ABC-type branched-subunit amino acid transport system substrate-binding protein